MPCSTGREASAGKEASFSPEWIEAWTGAEGLESFNARHDLKSVLTLTLDDLRCIKS